MSFRRSPHLSPECAMMRPTAPDRTAFAPRLLANLFATVLIAAVVACDRSPEPVAPELKKVTTVVMNASDVPERGTDTGGLFSWDAAPDSDLWNAEASHDSVFTVGLKAPGRARGV